MQIGYCLGLVRVGGEMGSDCLIDTGFHFGMMLINVSQPHRGSVCTQHAKVLNVPE